MHHPIIIAPLFVRRVDEDQRSPRRRRQQSLEGRESVAFLNEYAFAAGREIVP
jgi:hypothetical protein